MDMVSIVMQMVIHIKGTGKMISNKEMVD